MGWANSVDPDETARSSITAIFKVSEYLGILQYTHNI